MKRAQDYSNWYESKHNREAKRKIAAKRAKQARKTNRSQKMAHDGWRQ